MYFRCDVASVTEYLLLRTGATEHDALVAVPMRSVEHIEQRDASALAARGERVISRQHGGTIRLIDLGTTLYDAPVDGAQATYVHVAPDGEEGETLALRVRSVDGVCRGSIKSLPGMLQDSPLRGFLHVDGQVVGVLDFDRLLGRDRDDQRLERMIA